MGNIDDSAAAVVVVVALLLVLLPLPLLLFLSTGFFDGTETVVAVASELTLTDVGVVARGVELRGA